MVRSERQNGEVAMRNIRIGVVEDDPASCQLVLDYLNRYQQENGEQFTVSVFDDGARIVEKYTPVYDILLLDIEMSEMDGMAAARRIRERDDKVVIVFITAAPQYAISGYEVRALSYLLKPLPWFAFSQELKKSIDMVRRNGRIDCRIGEHTPYNTFGHDNRAFGAVDDADHQRPARHSSLIYSDLRMGCLHGVYRSAVSARSTPAVDHRQRGRTAAADCSAVF